MYPQKYFTLNLLSMKYFLSNNFQTMVFPHVQSYADHMLIICWCFFVRLDKYCLTRILFTLLLSPPLLFLYYSILYVYMFEGHAELPTIISQSIDLVTGGLTELYLSSQVLGSWVYMTVSTCVWPLWLAIWSINFQ